MSWIISAVVLVVFGFVIPFGCLCLLLRFLEGKKFIE
jgi:hypothetical protein